MRRCCVTVQRRLRCGSGVRTSLRLSSSVDTPRHLSTTTTTTIPSSASNPNDPSVATSEETTTTTKTTHFGFEDVPWNEKEGKVKEVFANVADSYDLMNDVMSGGLHRLWKDEFVRMTAVKTMAKMVRQQQQQQNSAKPPPTLDILDVAGGTGDIAFRMVDATDCWERSKSTGVDPVSITVCDINPEMLRVGEQRARARYGPTTTTTTSSTPLLEETKALSFVEGNAQDLVPTFADDSFDLYTIAFGLRNVTNVDRALREAHRVLKPGGRFLCLEFSTPTTTPLRSVYDLYSFHVIPAMGQAVANDRASYQYLVESIRKFSNQPELAQRMEQAGFENVSYTNLTGGIVAIHDGWKPL